jgi:hypothetical protein
LWSGLQGFQQLRWYVGQVENVPTVQAGVIEKGSVGERGTHQSGEKCVGHYPV